MPSSKGVSAGPIITAFLFSWPSLGRVLFLNVGQEINRDVPCHNIIGYGRRGHTDRRVCLHSLYLVSVSHVKEVRRSLYVTSRLTLKSRIRRRRAEVDMIDRYLSEYFRTTWQTRF